MTKHCRTELDAVAQMAKMDATELRLIMDELDTSLDVMSAALGVARRNIAAYRKDKPIPAYIALAVRQLRSMST